MPGAYPPAGPSLSGDLLTIHRLLQNPTYLQRRLRTIAELRFVADRILTQRLRSAGGAVAYETSEPIVNTRAIESVAPGAEYPRDSPADGTAALAKVSKWGQAVQLTDEKLKRSVYMGDELNRVLRKTANTARLRRGTRPRRRCSVTWSSAARTSSTATWATCRTRC
jgi:hypothetical protein